MSAPKWTPAQRAAIEDRGGTLLVSAAAGSGKTAVLVERAVRLITDAAHPVAADRLLIVTFTRAAAEELRGRIAVRLAAEAAAHPRECVPAPSAAAAGARQHLYHRRILYAAAQALFRGAGPAAGFELADDAKAYTLRQNALSAVLEELYEDADFCAFASLYGRARSDASAAAAVLGLYDFSRTLPHPAAALQSICAAYESGQPLGQTAWGRTLLENAGRAARSALRLLDAAKGIVAQEPELANYAPALDSDAAFFAALLEYIGAGRWDSAAVYTAEYKPPAFKAVRGYQSPGMNAVKALRAAAKDAAERLKKDVFLCTEAEFEEDRARIAPMAAALAVEQRPSERGCTKISWRKRHWSTAILSIWHWSCCAVKTAKKRLWPARCPAGSTRCLWTNIRIPMPCRRFCISASPTTTAPTCFLWAT